MGDVRFLPSYTRVRDAKDRSATLREMDDESVIAALAGAAMSSDPYIANVLATEGQNRARNASRALDAAPEAVLVLSYPLRRVVAANATARRLLPIELSALGGMTIESLLAQPADARFDALVEDAREPLEVRLRGSHRAFPAELRATPVVDETGMRTATTLVVQDLTEDSAARAWARQRAIPSLSLRAPSPWDVAPRAMARR